MRPHRLLVLASGRGSNFEALATAVKQGLIPHAEIVALISNKAEAKALDRAREFQIPTEVIASKDFRKEKGFDKIAYEKQLLKAVQSYHPDWIILAGYMLLLGEEIIQKFPKRILNIHPSLLPKFKGLNAQAQALEAREKETGCTVHFVDERMDEGVILEQSRLAILPDDTVESLSERLLKIEHETYVRVIKRLCQNLIKP